MIQITITYRCNNCNSNNIVKNGYNKCGNAQYHCKDCGVYRVLEPHQPYSEAMRQTILRAYKERASLRGLERIFKVSRQIISAWIKAYARRLSHLRATVHPARPDDVLELDEMWSFVGSKAEKRWLWMVMCRRTRQIVAFVIGDHSKATCKRLWARVPYAYRRCQSYSDFWEAYQVLPKKTHRCVGKATGQTAHMERWYNTVRQRVGRVVRKTLSFSKADIFHHLVLKWFIVEYNLEHSKMPETSLTT